MNSDMNSDVSNVGMGGLDVNHLNISRPNPVGLALAGNPSFSPLQLREVSSAVAEASRLLGAGVSFGYTAQGQRGELTLRLMPGDDRSPFVGPALAGNASSLTWFESALGPFALSDAEAVLSLLGELPVTLGGEHQPWYWQLVNQRMSTQLAELLCPLRPLSDITALSAEGESPNTAPMTCRLQLRLGSQVLHAQLCADARVMLQLLGRHEWQPHRQNVAPDWPIRQPLVLGELSLSLDQLASLQPGDVLLPSLCHFDDEGGGRLQLAGRQWAVQTDSRAEQLYVRFSHEEDLGHGQ
ncbi:type III secretion system protein [Pseudomonas petrae]|uniref:Type III secretion system protein n=1 Tax=Pseudomonas petrae TaxID=2912190 RepID=A0ABS9I720_9PSED|nr:type III secretion system protein [Pseudomonas petrae]MCF7534256.1 type III secretion system protein [Pseudomonas petrae]MCF7539702.1 type III secretion system protein [Pseudomonas petrae]MCF7543046.1 type III secretion system protein [Pseudomonas petrae]MCF7557989.1 type III secretion system protein [Pseudomonas petrae]